MTSSPTRGTTLRGPGRGMFVDAEQRPDLTEPLLEDLARPRPHREHAAPLGRRAALGLAVPDIDHPVLAELRAVGVAPEIGDIQHPDLVAPQSRTSRQP